MAPVPAPVAHRNDKAASQLPMTNDTWSHKEADRIVMAKYAPAGVVISPDMEILQFRGETAAYLAPASGRASLNLLKMARSGLLVPLRAAVNKAKKEAAPVREANVRVTSDDGDLTIDLHVIPLRGSSDSAFLVLFEDTATNKVEQSVKPNATSVERALDESDVARLTQELAATREYIQSLGEQYEAAHEEMRSASEEAQSSNEELQSINEELETSQEEFQSNNEELATVNDELNHRNLQLAQVNNDLANLLNSVQKAIVMLGQDLRIRRFTAEAGKILNLMPDDAGRAIFQLRLNVDIPDLKLLLTEVIDTVCIKEREVQDKNGHWYALQIRPYKTLENRIEGAVMLLIDVDALKRAREYAENIVATLREPLIVLDANLRVRSANQSFYRVFGGTPQETEGSLLYQLGNRQWDSPDLRQLLHNVLACDSPVEAYEVDHEFPILGRKIMLLNASKLAGQDHALILLAIEDITEHAKLEQARGHLDAFATADRCKNEFLAMLAHELRNPLAPLRNAIHILNDPAVDAEAARRVRELMERQIRNMSRLIDDLLDVARVTQGKIDLRKEKVELNAILSRALESVHDYARLRHQEIVVSLPSGPVFLEADPTRLEQIFANLLNNACKFTGTDGHIELTVERHNEEAVIRVRDDGIGISEEFLPRVFDLFSQGERALDRAQGGLGIGLRMVKTLVEAHGGSVAGRSAGPDSGSEFVVRLPITAGAERAAEPPLGVASAGPRRILVVDDNVDGADTLRTLLTMKGHDVRTAHDGPGALEAADAFHPDVVLLDIGLPGLNGYQVARHLRAQPQFAHTLLIALTGYGHIEDQRLEREAGMDHHLTKPADLDALDALLSGSSTR
jgi:two-component system, chemotaxis family, CheB/CheR fusion protein